MIVSSIKKGDLLIAEPSIIGDISFNRSIVFITEHSDEGSIGFILNKPLNYTIKDLIPEINAHFKIYNGGPVEQDSLYFIHIVPNLIPNSIEISEGIFWGGDFDSVSQLISEQKINHTQIKFFLGYSGWDKEQLEQELKSKAWVVSKNSYKKSIIEKDDQYFWKEKMLELGDEYSIWSNAPENPSAN